mmetsp:Transcript_517/g.939  ORF Transcript_517/g.939 Transcript_517/m.939 type:complete len:143 (-) Transcript_517:47-475(-)
MPSHIFRCLLLLCLLYGTESKKSRKKAAKVVSAEKEVSAEKVASAEAEQYQDLTVSVESAFNIMDGNQNGKLTRKEVKIFLEDLGQIFLGKGIEGKSDQEKKQFLREVFAKLDSNGDNRISKAEAQAGPGFVRELITLLQKV